MRGTSRSCVFTVGADATAHADSPRSFSIGSSFARSAFGHDDRAGAELVAGELEVVFGRQHLHVLVLEAERDEVVVAGVIDDEHAAGAFDAARRLRVGRQQRHRLIEDRSSR